jgi:Secretion system C-terminal sorting domain/Transglycosylase SLT domain/N-acetylmuramoyl-L-alanine amidase
MKKLNYFLTLLLVNFALLAQKEATSYDKLMKLTINKDVRTNGDVYLQANFDEVFGVTKNHKHIDNDHPSDEMSGDRIVAFVNQPHPNVETIRKYILEASKEFNVPFVLLDAIAKTYNNYNMLGPSRTGAYGIMGLIDSKSSNTLISASKLIDTNPELVRTNPRQNIRAAAALLSFYAENYKNSSNPLDWFDAVKKFSGLNYDDLQEMQAIDYFKVMNEGRSSITLWKEAATINPLKNSSIDKLIKDYDDNINRTQSINSKGATTGTIEYTGALSAFTNCNFNPSRSGVTIDTWVNHYIGVGTVASSINTFRDCNTEVSAHFIVGVDGKVYQVLQISVKAFANGAPGTLNNERSIAVEHDVTPSTPSNWNNEVMLKAGIRGHKEMPGVPAFSGTPCPANLPWTRWMQLLNGVTSDMSTTPVITAPAAGAVLPAGSAVNFSWISGVVGTPAYRIQVSKVNTGWTAVNGFTTSTTPTGNVVVNQSSGSLNYSWSAGSLGSSQGPLPGTTYFYTVRAFSAASGTSAYSAVRSFRINASALRESLVIGDALKVFPNPSNGDISLNFDSNSNSATLNLFDLSGVEVFSKKYQTKKGSNILTERISNLKNGNYILVLNDGEKVITQNIVITK